MKAGSALQVLRTFLHRAAFEMEVDLKQQTSSSSAPRPARTPVSSTGSAASGSSRAPTARSGPSSALSATELSELRSLRQENKRLLEEKTQLENRLNVAEAKLSRHDGVSKGISTPSHVQASQMAAGQPAQPIGGFAIGRP